MATTSAVACFSSCFFFFCIAMRYRGREDNSPWRLLQRREAQTFPRDDGVCSFTLTPSLSLSFSFSLPLSARWADNSARRTGLPHLHTHTQARSARRSREAELRGTFFAPLPDLEDSQSPRRTTLEHRPRMFPPPGDLFSMGIRCARQTRAHLSLRR